MSDVTFLNQLCSASALMKNLSTVAFFGGGTNWRECERAFIFCSSPKSVVSGPLFHVLRSNQRAP